ncbi:hypothetical protein PILCRDRAFT_86732 [Piloderma croceum F 1598]|uniref:Uncharacterized protein n=1 Tax=Piloderma croceum (strain F 1598) TaxID=765440 RepID=A0A0C3G2P1_PILCF|nr:hypothetical protein PILCRDRAFT_86732 [Piloderma croceum F 1598]
MASSQNYLDALTKDEVNALVVSATIRRDMLDLQERFPPHLASFMSQCIRIRLPKEQSVLSQDDGAYDASCAISKTKVFLSVLPVNSENEEEPKDLTLTCVHWSTFHRYGTGGARSETVSVSVNYGGISAKAYVTEYDDPGPGFAEWSHGYIGEVLTALLGDIGIEDSAILSEVELIEMLLGDDTKAHLDVHIAEDFEPLREVIDKKLEDSVEF